MLQTSSTFLDAEVSIENNTPVTTIYLKMKNKKISDSQNFLHVDSDYPKLLKGSISNSQVLWIKQISTAKDDFNQYCEELRWRFVNHGYKQELIIKKYINAVKKNGQARTFKRTRQYHLKRNMNSANINM